jgi:hypothetical protein
MTGKSYDPDTDLEDDITLARAMVVLDGILAMAPDWVDARKASDGLEAVLVARDPAWPRDALDLICLHEGRYGAQSAARIAGMVAASDRRRTSAANPSVLEDFSRSPHEKRGHGLDGQGSAAGRGRAIRAEPVPGLITRPRRAWGTRCY